MAGVYVAGSDGDSEGLRQADDGRAGSVEDAGVGETRTSASQRNFTQTVGPIARPSSTWREISSRWSWFIWASARSASLRNFFMSLDDPRVLARMARPYADLGEVKLLQERLNIALVAADLGRLAPVLPVADPASYSKRRL